MSATLQRDQACQLAKTSPKKALDIAKNPAMRIMIINRDKDTAEAFS